MTDRNRQRYSNVRRGRLVMALIVMLVGLAVAIPTLDVPERFFRVYERLSAKFGLRAANPLLEPITVAKVDDGDACDAAMPRHAAQMRFEGIPASHWRQQPGRLFVDNGHMYPVVLLITDIQGEQEYQAVSLHPGRGAQLQVPVGDYGVIALAGRSWCNMAQGFVDGAEVSVPQMLRIRADQAVRLGLKPYGSNPADMMFSFSESLGVPLADGVEGQGSLMLYRRGMHYVVEGTVNNQPLTFMVDTGATITSIPKKFAKEAGITQCAPNKARTANGIAKTCEAIAYELSIGQFRLRDVEISYSDKLSQPLLGMNVISLFHMEQQGDVMRLSRR
jgi:clan AA aspartic protease (TIGR02281 family)